MAPVNDFLRLEFRCALLGLFSVLLMMQRGKAYQYMVGGKGNWTVPSDPNTASYNQWAEKSRFQTGDTLVFIYPADQDSVLHVTKEDYSSCNTGSSLEKFSDGKTEFKFNQSGPYYFISGVKEHCQKNEKLVVIVMADRTKNNNSATPPSYDHQVIPSPAPSGEEAPSPPSVEINPSPAPSQEYSPPSPPSKNAASLPSGFASVVLASIGAFVGSYSFILAVF